MERPWETPDYEPDEDDEWRGDLHLGDWPEHLAGPEYWLYKQDEEEGTDDGPVPPQ